MKEPHLPPSGRQLELADVVEQLTRQRGFPPTLGEVAERLGCSESRAAQLARHCVERGVLTHERRVARSWRVVPAARRARQ